MADPTPADVYAAASLVGGRTSVAWNEILRLLTTNLPGSIDYFNTALNLTGAKLITKPKAVRVAPSVLDDTYLDTILVKVTTSILPMGTRQFQDQSTVAIYSINERQMVKDVVDASHDRSGPIAGILYDGLSGWDDPQGRRVWDRLRPLGKDALPVEYAGYEGVALIYEMVQGPGGNTWT